MPRRRGRLIDKPSGTRIRIGTGKYHCARTEADTLMMCGRVYVDNSYDNKDSFLHDAQLGVKVLCGSCVAATRRWRRTRDRALNSKGGSK